MARSTMRASSRRSRTSWVDGRCCPEGGRAASSWLQSRFRRGCHGDHCRTAHRHFSAPVPDGPQFDVQRGTCRHFSPENDATGTPHGQRDDAGRHLRLETTRIDLPASAVTNLPRDETDMDRGFVKWHGEGGRLLGRPPHFLRWLLRVGGLARRLVSLICEGWLPHDPGFEGPACAVLGSGGRR